MRTAFVPRLALAAALFALAGTAPASAGVGIVHAFPGWREAASFKRISEYFTGQENTGGEIVRRTHPDQRGGYYFLLRMENDGPAVSARVALQVVLPGSPEAKTFTFSVTLPEKTCVLDLGLTGADWPGPKINAVAWRFEVTDESGRVLATEKSYLWDKPAGS